MSMFAERLPGQERSNPPLLQIADVLPRVPGEAEHPDPQQSEIASTGDERRGGEVEDQPPAKHR